VTHTITSTPSTDWWGSDKYLRCRTYEGYRTVLDLTRSGLKVAAIKALRSETGCGLASGKAAVERAGDPSIYSGPQILPPLHLKSITLDIGEGEVTVDLEGLQLLGLMRMESVGIEDCRHIISLVDAIQTWQAGVSGAFPRSPVPTSP
jgi:hypothetical protein